MKIDTKAEFREWGPSQRVMKPVGEESKNFLVNRNQNEVLESKVAIFLRISS